MGRNGVKTNYIVQEVPHKKQRYETVGDWIPGKRGEPTVIKASTLRDSSHVFAVQIHELVEERLCKLAGIKDENIVTFDLLFDEERKAGLQGKNDEPGDDPRAPYHKQHLAATEVEKLVLKQQGGNWKKYEKAIAGLSSERRH